MIEAIKDNWWYQEPDEPTFAWRGKSPYCLKENGDNTGLYGYQTLEQYNVETGELTGNIKPNVSTDSDYIAPIQDLNNCPLPEPTYIWEGYQPYCITEEEYDLGWRGIDPTCLTNSNGDNQGYYLYDTLEQYEIQTGNATGVTKPNVFGDPDYISPIKDETFCPLPEPNPDPDPTEPVQGCRVHFSGVLMSDTKQNFDFSIIYQEDIYSELVGAGEYNDTTDAFARASTFTFDSIAADVGTKVTIYSQPNFQGEILLNKEGPFLLFNHIWSEAKGDPDHPYRTIYDDEFFKTFEEPLQSNYPHEVRFMSETDMHAWSYGSVKVECGYDQPPNPDPIITKDTKIIILFDDSGSMNGTELNKMKQGKLKDVLIDYYDSDILYDERIEIKNFGDFYEHAWERTFYEMGHNTQHSDVIYFIFQNEANGSYHKQLDYFNPNQPLTDGTPQNPGSFKPDMDALNNLLDNTNIKLNATIFQVSGYEGFKQFLKVLKKGGGNYIGEYSLVDRDNIKIKYDVSGTRREDADNYYSDLIIEALNNLGYNI